MAKDFLRECSASFQYHDTSNAKEYLKASFMMEEEGVPFNTVPQIFICDKYVGNATKLMDLQVNKQFEPLMDKMGVFYKKCPDVSSGSSVGNKVAKLNTERLKDKELYEKTNRKKLESEKKSSDDLEEEIRNAAKNFSKSAKYTGEKVYTEKEIEKMISDLAKQNGTNLTKQSNNVSKTKSFPSKKA